MTDVTVTSTHSSRRAVRGAEAVQAAVLALIEHAERTLAVYAPVLQPALLNGTAQTRALAQFAARHRSNTLRLLVDDAAQALRDNDRLVNVSRRLSDAIKWHEVEMEARGGGELFIIADGRACLYVPDRLRNDADWAETKDPLPVDLQQRFDALWERSQPATALRPAGL